MLDQRLDPLLGEAPDEDVGQRRSGVDLRKWSLDDDPSVARDGERRQVGEEGLVGHEAAGVLDPDHHRVPAGMHHHPAAGRLARSLQPVSRTRPARPASSARLGRVMSVRRLLSRCGSGPDEPEWPDELGLAAVLAPRGRRAAGRCGSVHREAWRPLAAFAHGPVPPPRPGRGCCWPGRSTAAPGGGGRRRARLLVARPKGGPPAPAESRPRYRHWAWGGGLAAVIDCAPVPGGNVLGRAAHGAHAPAPAPPVRRRAAPPAGGPGHPRPARGGPGHAADPPRRPAQPSSASSPSRCSRGSCSRP